MLGNMLNDLAEAIRRWTEKKAFTREMTRILRDKQTHPLIVQMMRPAESSDPPPATAAASSASSSREPRTTSHVQFQCATRGNVEYPNFPSLHSACNLT